MLNAVATVALVLSGLMLSGCGGQAGDSANGSTGSGIKPSPETVLYSFGASATDGVTPQGMFQGSDGNFYGWTYGGGADGGGTMFKITPSGVETVLHSFANSPPGEAAADGVGTASIFEGTDGNFYGVTVSGGINGGGTVFQMTPAGIETVLYSFGIYNSNSTTVTDGSGPTSLIEASDGNFYGVTASGGTLYPSAGGEPSGSGYFSGTEFRLTPTGVETSVPLQVGLGPFDLFQATNGNFYGLTANTPFDFGSGGPGEGTAFQITADGTQASIHFFFQAGDGITPESMIQGTDGSLYGVTSGGGANRNASNIYLGAGALFRLNTVPVSEFTILYSFGASAIDGNGPVSVIQGADSNFYGVTGNGGAYGGSATVAFSGYGTVFRITAAGEETVLYSFGGRAGDGIGPSGLIQGTDGNFYGITLQGGANNGGTLFKLLSSAGAQ